MTSLATGNQPNHA